MNGRLKALLDALIKNFARPPIDKNKNSENKIVKADEAISELTRKKRELEARLRLLQIQGTPRGDYD